MTGIVAQNVGRTSGLVKAASGGGGGVWTLIKTLTSDGSDADLSFVNGSSDVTLDSTYPIYVFKFINIHPETDNVQLRHNASTDAGSNYNLNKTSTFFDSESPEATAFTAGMGYVAGHDIANSTSPCEITFNVGNDNDQGVSGVMWLFNPSSTTYMKHFVCQVSSCHRSDGVKNSYTAGYYNTTDDIDAIQFTFSSDEIQGGSIKLYGLSDS